MLGDLISVLELLEQNRVIVSYAHIIRVTELTVI
jgi:hypothetical protein